MVWKKRGRSLAVWLWRPANPVNPISLIHQPLGQLGSLFVSVLYYRLARQPNLTACASLQNLALYKPTTFFFFRSSRSSTPCRRGELSHLKDGDPGVADVVEVDGPLEGVDHTGGAVDVVLVPVDARGVVGAVVRVHVQVALQASLLVQLGHRVAVPHAVLSGLRADEGVLVVVFSVVVFPQLHGERAAGEEKKDRILLGFLRADKFIER